MLRKIGHIILVVLAIFLLLNLLLIIAFNTDYVQKKAVTTLTNQLKEKTQTELSIGKVRIDLLKGLRLNDVYIEDQRQDTLAFIKELQANYSFKSLYKNHTLCLSEVSLTDFIINLTKENDSTAYNYQFLIDAFSNSEESKEESSFALLIDHIRLNNGSFNHIIQSEEPTPNLFNASHLQVSDIHTDIYLNLSLPQVEAEIYSLSGNEQSGLNIKDLTAKGSFILDSLLSIPQFKLETPHSIVVGSDLSYLFASNHCKGTICPSHITATDFVCFSPALQPFTEDLRIELNADIPLPAVHITHLNADYSNKIHISGDQLSMSDCTNWQDAIYKINLQQLSAEPGATQILSNALQQELPTIIDSLLPLNTSLRAMGSLQKLTDELSASTPLGTIETQGILSYQPKKNRLSANNEWNIDITSLLPFAKKEVIQSARGKIESTIDWQLEQKPHIILSSELNHLNVMQYDYDTIYLAGTYTPENALSMQLTTNDPNLTGEIQLTTHHFLEKEMETELHTNIQNIHPFKIHLTDTLEQLSIAAQMDLNGKGMDYEQWDGSILFDSLHIINGEKSIALGEMTLKQEINEKQKHLTLSSNLLKGEVVGEYQYSQLYVSLLNILNKYLPTLFAQKTEPTNTQCQFNLTIANTDELAKFFDLPLTLPQPIKIKGSLTEASNEITCNIHSPLLIYKEAKLHDSRVDIKTRGESLFTEVESQFHPNKNDSFALGFQTNAHIYNDVIYNQLVAKTLPDSNFVNGKIKHKTYLHTTEQGEYDIISHVEASTLTLNNQQLDVNPSTVHLLSDKIKVENLGLSMNKKPLFKTDGMISSSLEDTLNISFQQLQLHTILALLLKNDIPADCKINGEVKTCGLLGDGMRFFTKGLRADSFTYQGFYVADMTANAIWDNSKGGMFAHIAMERDQQNTMDIKGVVAPSKNFMYLKAQLDSFPIASTMPFAKEYVSNLSGEIGANIDIKGEIFSPEIIGELQFKQAKAKINYTGVTYTINDSILFEGNHFLAKHFCINDDEGNKLFLTGDITHDKFQKYNYKLQLDMSNFALLKNPKNKEALVNGNFYANGKKLTLEGDEKSALITGEFSNADKTSINITLPETVTEAYNYDNIVYVKAESSTDSTISEVKEYPFDLSADLSIGLTDQASFYISIAEGAMIKGNGNLHLTYYDGNLALYNRFTVSDGFMKIRISGLPTKKFTLQEGSYVEFNGDPMKLKFNATATYGLTADLNTLSNTFSSMGLSSTRVPVNCNLLASGDLTAMDLDYEVVLPKSDNNIVQNVNNIINTDNIKIKEFAYLIGLGMFSDPSGQTQSDALISFASSSLSATINNALGGVLGDKITIGTDFNSSQDDFSDIEMSVSVSTKLLNDKLLLSTNLGYQAQSENNSNFLGDFDAEYSIGKSGMFRIKAYNHTNNEFYRTANNTQGLGFSFVRESKKLKDLFKFKKDKELEQATAADSSNIERRNKDEE